MQRVLSLIVVAACGNTPAADRPHRSQDQTAHGGGVRRIAITEQGDAALTVDDASGLWLWPALDGTREPIAIAATVEARQVAIGHRPRGGYLAGLIDPAGGVELLELSADGAVDGRAQLPIDPAATEVVAYAGDMLVLRADQSVSRVDGSGRVLGRIVADPGTQIAAIAVRAGRAAAGPVDGTVLRWLDLAHGIAWGPSLELPIAIDGPIAIAPGGQRLAAFDASLHTAIMIELATVPSVVACPRLEPAIGGTDLGFLDDDHVVVPGGKSRHVTRVGTCEDAAPPPIEIGASPLAIGDGIAIAAERGGLEVATASTVEHLGYHRMATSFLDAYTGDHGELWMWSRQRPDDSDTFVIDDELRDRGSVTDGLHRVATHIIVLDGEHGAMYRRNIGPVVVGRGPAPWPDGATSWDDHVYDPITHVLGSPTASGYQLFRYDLASATLSAIQTIVPTIHRGEGVRVHVADPKLAGIAAVATSAAEIQWFPAAPGAPPVDRPYLGTLVVVDRAGTVYTREHDTLVLLTPGGVTRVRFPFAVPSHDDDDDDDDDDDEKPRRRASPSLASFAPVPRIEPEVVPSHDARRVALLGSDRLVVIDSTGRARWDRPIDDPVQVRWGAGDRRLLVLTSHGMLALDAITGKPVVRACGWRFGRTREPLPQTVYAAPTVCE